MKDHKPTIGELLREHDPAREKTLDEATSRRMRATVLDSVQTARRASRPSLAFATILIAVIGGWLLIHTRRPADPASVTDHTPTIEVARPEPAVPEEKTTRQIQYTTTGGTRVIWTLDPDFEL